MDSIPISQFKNNIQDLVKQVIHQHIPLKITDRLIYKFDDQYIFMFAIGGHYDQFN